MLTDRQQQYYERIGKLLLLSSAAKVYEKTILSDAKNALDNGKDFKQTIQLMMQELMNLEEPEIYFLTKDVKKLLDDLIETYGAPTPIKKGWERSDPDYIFIGGGKAGGSWRSREAMRRINREAPPFNLSYFLLQWLKLVFIVVSVIGAALFLALSPLIPAIQSKFGNSGVTVFILGLLIVIMIILAFIGRFKQKKK